MKRRFFNLTREKVPASKVSLWKSSNIFGDTQQLQEAGLFTSWVGMCRAHLAHQEPVNFTRCLYQILISCVKYHVHVAQYVRKCLNEALSIYWTSLTLTAAGKRFPLLSSPRGQWWNQNFHECKFQLQLILMTMTSLLYEVHNEPDHSLAKSHDKLQACPSGYQCFLYPRFKRRLPPASVHEEPSSAIDKWLFCFTFFFN